MRSVSVLSLGLLLTLNATAARAADFRLGHDVVPTFEAVTLETDPDRSDYHGVVRVELKVAKSR